MVNRFFLLMAGCAVFVLINSCGSSKKTTGNTTTTTIAATPDTVTQTATVEATSSQPSVAYPKAMTEFRAAWVASVDNINWPSRKGLSTETQQKEAIALLDFLKDHHFNAVIFQVRPQGDALYKSSFEPWSYYLTGTQGKAPEPFYDPLQFWIEAAHERGIELHVWLNPYRAHTPSGGPVTETSLVKKRPELVVKLKDGHWWFDPSLKGTQDHSTEVVMDIVKRYDIDGVHFDDYFYPYPSYNNNVDFPDSVSWDAYVKGGGKLNRGDWRRKSVNDFIERIYKAIKSEKPYVKFGLSPFGMYRPGYPSSIEGFDQYSQLYADARLWLNEGWIDYFTPQIYWRISAMTTSFPILLGWWSSENKKGRHLWPGMNVGRDTTASNSLEVVNQIMVTRGMVPNSAGEVHWSIGPLAKDTNLAKAVVVGPYKKLALVPPSPWLDNKAPEAPAVKTEQIGDSLKITWTHNETSDIFRWVVYFQYAGKWNYTILNRNDRSFMAGILSGKFKLDNIAVTAVDRTGNESKFNAIRPTIKYTVDSQAATQTATSAASATTFNMVSRSGWGAAEARPYKQQVPVRITIHHEGTRIEPTDDAAKKIKNIQTWSMGKDRNWSDVPYHFLIGLDGTVYEGRNPLTAGETATEYDPTGHILITCMGNLEEQEVSGAQLNALIQVTAYACKKYNISYETIAAHKDYSQKTDCPGKNLYKYVQSGYLKTKVKELLK